MRNAARHSAKLSETLRNTVQHRATDHAMLQFTVIFVFWGDQGLSLRRGVAVVCFEVTIGDLLCLVGWRHVISGILAGGIPGFAWCACCFDHLLVWPGDVFVLPLVSSAIPS